MRVSIFLLMFFIGTASANLNKMECKGHVKKFQNYVRLAFDTDSEDDFVQHTHCNFRSLEPLLNNKSNYNLQFGIRMSDTINHDKNDEDYMTIDTGMANITLETDKISIQTKTNKEVCKVNIFENESDKDYSHKNIFNTRVQFQNNKVSLLYAPKNQRKWTMCASVFVSSFTKRHIDIYTHSKFGINIDIINMDVDAQHAPWISKRIIDKVVAPQHALDHHQEIIKIKKNITNKEFARLGSSIQMLWYYQIFITGAILLMIMKYKRDRTIKMHLL